jgi:predicted nucleic acid-binding protein
MDACALIAYMNDEDGAETIGRIIDRASVGNASLSMGKVNLLEVYYGIFRDVGEAEATEVLNELLLLPVRIIDDISDATFLEAGRLKAVHKISIADALALALASVTGAWLLTSDHHEFDAVERAETVKIAWIR